MKGAKKRSHDDKPDKGFVHHEIKANRLATRLALQFGEEPPPPRKHDNTFSYGGRWNRSKGQR